MQVAVQFASEVNPASIRVSTAGALAFCHISEIAPENHKDILDKAPRAASHDLTGHTTSRKDVDVESTKALTHLLDIMAWTVKLFSQLKVEFLVEIMADAPNQLVSTIFHLTGVYPWFLCAAQVSCTRWPGLCWTSFHLVPVWEGKFVPEELWNHVQTCGNFDRWISEGASWPAGNKRARLLTAVGEKPRRHPPGEPAGIGQCDNDALKRWILDEYIVPPCHHRWKYCILDGRGYFRRPCVAEKERLMGFPAAYTEPAVSSSELKHNPRGSEMVRGCLLGDTFHVEVLSWFLAHLAVEL